MRVAAVLFGISLVIWSQLEAKLWQAVFIGVFAAAIALGRLIVRFLAGRELSIRQLVAIFLAAGLFLGLGSTLFTLAAMILKTGLHAHGPEFSQAELLWVTRQASIWSVAGMCGGLGAAMLFLYYRVPRSSTPEND